MVLRTDRLGGQALLLVTAIALSLAGCGSSSSPEASQTAGNKAVAIAAKAPAASGIQVDGSSTVYPLTDAVAKAFRGEQTQSTPSITVAVSGTGGGLKRFCAGETDISNASRPILREELEACEKSGVRFLELPVAFDALTVVVHPANTWAKDITLAELRKVWESAAQGKITRWNQIRPEYPDRPLTLFGPGSDSGTFDYFTEVVAGETGASRTDYTASEDDTALVDGVAKDPNALGYFGFSYYEDNRQRLKALAVNGGEGAIAPSRETVESTTYQPFSRPLLIYVNATAAQRKPELRAFVEFYLKNAAAIAADTGYVPLPAEGYELADIQFHRGEVGTVFEGVPQPRLTIAELLRKQAQFQVDATANSTTP